MSPLSRFARGKKTAVFEAASDPVRMIWKRENPEVSAVTR